MFYSQEKMVLLFQELTGIKTWGCISFPHGLIRDRLKLIVVLMRGPLSSFSLEAAASAGVIGRGESEWRMLEGKQAVGSTIQHTRIVSLLYVLGVS